MIKVDEFKVGDEVEVFGYGVGHLWEFKGVVLSQLGDKHLKIKMDHDDSEIYTCHPKQCRLVSRKTTSFSTSAASLQPYRCESCHVQMANAYPYCYSCALRIANEKEISFTSLCDSLAERIDNIEESDAYLKSVIKSTEEIDTRVDEIENLNKYLNSTTGRLTERVHDLENSVTHLQAERQSLKDRTAKLETAHRDTSDRINTMTKQLDKLECKEEHLNASLISLKEERAFKCEISALSQRISELWAAFTEDRQDLRDRIVKGDNQYQELLVNYHQLREDFSSILKCMREYRKE